MRLLVEIDFAAIPRAAAKLGLTVSIDLSVVCKSTFIADIQNGNIRGTKHLNCFFQAMTHEVFLESDMEIVFKEVRHIACCEA